jgi:hypothetical protein
MALVGAGGLELSHPPNKNTTGFLRSSAVKVWPDLLLGMSPRQTGESQVISEGRC